MSHVAQAKSTISEGRDEVMRTLVIGDLPKWAAEGRDIAGDDIVSYLALDQVTQAKLQELDPEIVLSPLVSGNFDACDVAAALVEAQFAGRYRAVSHPTTDKAIITAEIAIIAPDLDFDILEVK